MKVTASFFKPNKKDKKASFLKHTNINSKYKKNQIKVGNIKFNNANKNIKISNLFEVLGLKLSFWFGMLIFVTLTFVPEFINVNKILYFATNLRDSSQKLVNLNLAEAFLLYNKNNYLLNNIDENIILKANNSENKTIEELDEETKYLNKEVNEVIDLLAEENMVSSVFWDKKHSITMTENTDYLQRISIDKMKILNYSDNRSINFEEILNNTVNLTKKSDKILLYSTHTSESYANSENYKFDYTGVSRTTDARYNMLAVGKQLESNLREKGFDVIHDTTPHDYGTYTSSYARSQITVQNNLKKYGSMGICIDLHRDAIADLNYAPKIDLKGHKIAKCMFVIGIGNDTTKNPYYQDNLKLALKLQMIADDIYPDLFRPMIIRNSVYNQDLNKYSLLIEVGATGNTLEEVFLATRCITNLLNIIYKD